MPGNIPTPPASVIASWPTPNYLDPERKAWLTPYACALQGVSTLLVLARLAARLRNEGGGLGFDDALLIPSWLFSIGFTAVAVYSERAGLTDRHIWDLLPSKFEDDTLNAWIGTFLFLVGTGCLKLSVLFFYRRIQAGTYNRQWKYAIWAAVAFTIIYTLSMLFALIFNCSPTWAYWKAYDKDWDAQQEYHCAETGIVNLIAGILSIVSDLYSIVLPCLMLQGLEMPRRQKVTLNAIFAIGLVTVGAAAGRTHSYYQMSQDYDFTWVGHWVYFWTTLEYGLGLICACAPSLRVFVKQYLGGSLHSRRRRRGESEGELTDLRPETSQRQIMRKTSLSVTSDRIDDGMEKSELMQAETHSVHNTDIPRVPSETLDKWDRPRALSMASVDMFRLGTARSADGRSGKSGKSGHSGRPDSDALGLDRAMTPRDGIQTPAGYEEYVLHVLKERRRSFLMAFSRERAETRREMSRSPPPGDPEMALTALPARPEQSRR
ncbi:hypothetical protein LTR53_014829 [Teratosphaeriaceae sp. CCFEE 6253]|nr:hypothetical protein LTR53_014829 [Teratosphaeriaceae sp. CCFEE 6253]